MYFTVFGKENCPYCVRAKELLQSKLLEFTYRDVVEDEVAFLQMNSWVAEATGFPARTVPQIFLDQEYIGGYTELSAYFSDKEKETISFEDDTLGEL